MVVIEGIVSSCRSWMLEVVVSCCFRYGAERRNADSAGLQELMSLVTGLRDSGTRPKFDHEVQSCRAHLCTGSREYNL